MKIKNNPKKNIKRIILLSTIGLAIFIGAGWLVFAFATNMHAPASPSSTIDYNPPTAEQIDNGQKIKEDSLNGDDTSSETYVNITASEVSGDKYLIRTFINKIDNTGTCTISFESSTSKLIDYQTAQVQPLPEGSTCSGFNIPLSALSESSSWTVSIKYSSVSGEITTASKEIFL